MLVIGVGVFDFDSFELVVVFEEFICDYEISWFD